jgi:serine protease Do
MMPRFFAAGLLFVVLGTLAAFADETVQTRIFQLPRYEAEQVVVEWFEHAGFDVTRATSVDLIVLSATLKGKEWRVILRHNSPLATEISADTSKTKGGADELWKYLTGYMEGYSTTRVEPRRSEKLQETLPPRDDSSKKIPDTVLSRVNAVVCISAAGQENPTQLTGFIVDKDGLILCTAHTLQKQQKVTIVLPEGQKIKGRLIKMDTSKDLALIDCNYRFSDVIALSNGKAMPDIGGKVFAIGCPLNYGGTVLSGFVSGPSRLVLGHPLVQVRMEVEPGSSGSPVFDDEGDLIGMVQGRLKKDHLSGLLIPMETVITFVKEK